MKNTVAGWILIIKSLYVTKSVTSSHHFKIVTQGGSNCAHFVTYFSERGIFRL